MALQEYYNTDDDTNVTPTSTAWFAMTWTTTSAYSISSVKLKIYRGATPPANVIVGIRATSGGLPTGEDLTSGSIAGAGLLTTPGQFEEISLTPYALDDATKYAIVVRVDTVSCGWRVDNSSPSYSGGNGASSTNSGEDWTARTWDNMFEVYGSTETFSELSGTIAAVSTVEDATLDTIAFSSLSGTIAAVSNVAAASLGQVAVSLAESVVYTRLVAVGNGRFYYEAI